MSDVFNGMWPALIEALKADEATIRDAPLVFWMTALVVVLCLCCLSAMQARRGPRRALEAKNVAIADLSSRLEAAAGSNERLEGDLAAQLHIKSYLAAMHDYDGVYQAGEKVGSAVSPEVDVQSGLIIFANIADAARFDIAKRFEYRGFSMAVVHIGSMSHAIMGGRENRGFVQVSCRIAAVAK